VPLHEAGVVRHDRHRGFPAAIQQRLDRVGEGLSVQAPELARLVEQLQRAAAAREAAVERLAGLVAGLEAAIALEVDRVDVHRAASIEAPPGPLAARPPDGVCGGRTA